MRRANLILLFRSLSNQPGTHRLGPTKSPTRSEIKVAQKNNPSWSRKRKEKFGEPQQATSRSHGRRVSRRQGSTRPSSPSEKDLICRRRFSTAGERNSLPGSSNTGRLRTIPSAISGGSGSVQERTLKRPAPSSSSSRLSSGLSRGIESKPRPLLRSSSSTRQAFSI